jgi:hypothetical protein
VYELAFIILYRFQYFVFPSTLKYWKLQYEGKKYQFGCQPFFKISPMRMLKGYSFFFSSQKQSQVHKQIIIIAPYQLVLSFHCEEFLLEKLFSLNECNDHETKSNHKSNATPKGLA